ncbi:MAG: hypothetical protein HUU31_17985 [Anaerolineae bacterium]|nr:hypothetical protein [Anaerolineae bacterium]
MTTPKLFPIQEHPYRSIYPGRSKEGHPLIGFTRYDYIVIARFATNGELQGAEVVDWTRPKVQREDESPDAFIKAREQEFELTRAHLRTLGFASLETVSVQKFWLPGTDFIGITQYPVHLAPFLEPHESEYEDIDPISLDDFERDELREQLREWRERGDFVLYYGNDYWCDPDGEINSS